MSFRNLVLFEFLNLVLILESACCAIRPYWARSVDPIVNLYASRWRICHACRLDMGWEL